MMSMQNLFYGEAEPVWIVKPEKDDKKKGNDSGSNKKEVDDTILATIPYYPYYYPDYVAPAPAKENVAKAGDKKETKVVMKVPICCGDCVESIEVALYAMGGVKSVESSVRNQKVTVVATKAAPADILLECRKLFRKSKIWSDND